MRSQDWSSGHLGSLVDGKSVYKFLEARDAPVDELEARQNIQSVCVSTVTAVGLLGSWDGSGVSPFQGMKRTNVLIDSQPCRATQHSLLERPTPVAGTARVMGLSLTQLRTLRRLSSKGH